MRYKRELFVSILIGLALLPLLEHWNMSGFTAEIVCAFIVSMWLSKKLDKHLVKYAFISIFSYNVLRWALILMFTHDGRIVLQYGSGVAVFSIVICLSAFFYATIGSLIASITCRPAKCSATVKT